MQFKHVLTVGLSLMLLCVSAWASVCELSCSLSHAYPVSKLTKDSKATQVREVSTSETNAPHSHCGHAKTTGPSSAANHSFENTCKCTDAPCAQAQTLSRVNRQDGTRPGGVHFAVLAHTPTVTSNILFSTAKPEHVLTRILQLDTMSVSLRI